MNTPNDKISSRGTVLRRASRLAASAALLCLAGGAFADEPVTMAPPIESAYSNGLDGGQVDVSANSVFNWADVPQDQQVPIRRAVFDRGGYQLYDTVGETIVVPFTNQNLYVMKFGLSNDGSTYFVNEGNAPVLYVPRGAYLENAAVPGARWFPFPQNYEYAHPVFLGIAPSWREYCDMGWYPEMRCYGGYWCERPFISIGTVFPTFGLFIEFGGHHFNGWDHYHDYYRGHEAPFHLTVVNNDVYREGGRPGFYGRPFEGGNAGYRAYGQGRVYPGGRTVIGGSHTVTGARPFGGIHTYGNARPTIQTPGRPFEGGRTEGRTFGGGAPTGSGTPIGSGRVFQGGRPSDGTRPFGDARPTESAHPFGGVRTYGTPRPESGSGAPIFRGGSSSYGSGGERTYSNGGSTPSGGGRPVFNGGDRTNNSGSSGSGRSYGGGDRTYGSGSGRSSTGNGGSRPSSGGGERASGSSQPSGRTDSRSSGGFSRPR